MSETLSAAPRALEPTTIQRGIQLTPLDYCALFGLFYAYGFVLFLGPFNYMTRFFLPPSLSLLMERPWVSPTIAGGISVDYPGFGIPLIVSVASIVCCCWKLVPAGIRRIRITAKVLLVAIPLSLLASQVTFALSDAGPGSIDLFIFFVTCVYLFVLALRASLAEAALMAYPLGFLIGLLSDLESLLHVTGPGVIGGYGLADGDFLIPLAFLISTILFAKTWRRALEVVRRIAALATKVAGEFLAEIE